MIFNTILCVFFFYRRIGAIVVQFFGQSIRFTVKWDQVFVSFRPDRSLLLLFSVSSFAIVDAIDISKKKKEEKFVPIYLLSRSRQNQINSENYFMQLMNSQLYYNEFKCERNLISCSFPICIYVIRTVNGRNGIVFHFFYFITFFFSFFFCCYSLVFLFNFSICC